MYETLLVGQVINEIYFSTSVTLLFLSHQ